MPLTGRAVSHPDGTGVRKPSTGKGIANPIATFWTACQMLEHLGEHPAANRLMRAVERVTADPSLHTPDLGGRATTRQVTDAVIAAIRGDNE